MDKLRELMPDAAKVLTEAEATGADIKVPLAKVFELRLKDKSLAENVRPWQRFDRDGMSIGEARAYDATGRTGACGQPAGHGNGRRVRA